MRPRFPRSGHHLARPKQDQLHVGPTRPVRCLGPWFLSPFDLNKLQRAKRRTRSGHQLCLATCRLGGPAFGPAGPSGIKRSVGDQSTDRSTQVVAEFSEIIGGAVGKLTVGLGPHEFGRVELGRVGGKQVHAEPRVRCDELAHDETLVNRTAIPEEVDGTA